MTTITFITGANKGLGYATARRLTELGQTVIVGARDAARGQAAAESLGARFVPIDVTDDGSVLRAAADVEAHEGRIDTLINNAGIIGARVAASELTGDDAWLVFDTNVISVVRVTNAFLPLLQAVGRPGRDQRQQRDGLVRAHPRPGPGRVDDRLAALHRVQGGGHDDDHPVREGDPRRPVQRGRPGYTATDLNGHSGHQTVAEGTDAIVALASEDPSAGTGRFVDRFGPVAW